MSRQKRITRLHAAVDQPVDTRTAARVLTLTLVLLCALGAWWALTTLAVIL